MTSSAGTAVVGNPSVAVEPLTTNRVVSSRRFSIGSSALAVIVVGSLITAGLAVGAKVLHDANEHRLLGQRVREAAAVASSSFVGVQTPLASAAVLAEATDGDAESFRQVMQPIIDAGRPFVSVSIWPTGQDAPQPVVVLGSQPELTTQSPEAVSAFLRRAPGAPTVVLYDLLDQRERRLGYASAASGQAKFVVYAEGSLPHDRRARIEKDSAFAGLDYSLFLGKEQNADSLLASSTGGASLQGHTASASVPFGDTELLVVMSAREELGGLLLARLWWILILLGLTLTIAAAVLVERLTHRRRQAEELATENAELYAAQRSVALDAATQLAHRGFPAIAGSRDRCPVRRGSRGHRRRRRLVRRHRGRHESGRRRRWRRIRPRLASGNEDGGAPVRRARLRGTRRRPGRNLDEAVGTRERGTRRSIRDRCSAPRSTWGTAA